MNFRFPSRSLSRHSLAGASWAPLESTLSFFGHYATEKVFSTQRERSVEPEEAVYGRRCHLRAAKSSATPRIDVREIDAARWLVFCSAPKEREKRKIKFYKSYFCTTHKTWFATKVKSEAVHENGQSQSVDSSFSDFSPLSGRQSLIFHYNFIELKST